MKSILTKLTAIIATGLLFVTGCDLGSSPDPGFGSLEVRLHDAPGDYQEVNIFVERVEIKREGEGEEWRVISEPNKSFDLLKLTNGVYEVLGSTELEAGFYNQIRLIVGRENNNVVIDDEFFDLFVPSGEQTGVKLNVQAEIEGGSELVVMLDFDADRSVVKRGKGNASTEYLLKPVVRASILDNVGSIAGTVLPVESRSVVYAISGSDTLSTTYANLESGDFKLMGLEEGIYTVAVEPREDTFIGIQIEDVEVQVGEVTDLDVIELDSEEEENDENGD